MVTLECNGRKFWFSATMVLMFNKLKKVEKNELVLHRSNAPTIFLRQLKNPLLLILVAATIASFFLGDKTDSLVILTILLASVILGFWNEYSAERTIADLLRKVSLTATVLQDGVKREIPARDLVVGDTVLLATGSVVPADLKLTTLKNLEIDEAVLTGESFPVIKKENNLAFAGTTVTSGSGMGEVIAIGRQTKFGKVAVDLSVARPETEFQKGLRSFGMLLVQVVVVMTAGIFVVNAFLGHPLINSAMFALAIAIGITPELLPVVVTVSLSHGAREMAKKEVVVKQLVTIEDLGNMEVLCTDKTGTITEGKISLISYFDEEGKPNEEILNLALLCNNAVVYQRILGDAIDSAIWEYARLNNYQPSPDIQKMAEGPFDFKHRAMFTVVDDRKKLRYILKGAPEEVVAATDLNRQRKLRLYKKFEELSGEGYRVVAVAAKKIETKKEYSFADARGLKFVGFITFSDVPKKTAKAAIEKLGTLGVAVKIVTGDNELVTKHVCRAVGIPCNKILLGQDLEKMSDEELRAIVWQTEVFARVSPEGKLRVIEALRAGGHTVGYLGDGVNDAPALHVADVAISVNSAVDVAKDTATIVLLRKSLSVIAEGVTEGRRIFNNTIKYILMGTSSNFGNMFSAAGASFILPFLPMTPAQILLTDSLYDISQLAIPTDNVDPELLLRPRRWDVNLIKKFMLFFGPISSIYDFLTFGIMFFVFHARNGLFQTGWFVESLVTEVLVVFIIRTRRVPFFRSLPSRALLLACLGVVGFGVLLPFSPLGKLLAFVSPPPLYFAILIVLTLTYLGIVEIGKSFLVKGLSDQSA